MMNYSDSYIMDIKSQCRKLENMAWPWDKEGIAEESSDLMVKRRDLVSGNSLNKSLKEGQEDGEEIKIIFA